MARKSKLTPQQWEDIKRRHIINGESVNSLAKEYGIDEGTIRSYLKKSATSNNNSDSSENNIPNNSEKANQGRKEAIQNKALQIIRDLSESGLPEDDAKIALELANNINTVKSKLVQVADNNLHVALELSKLAKNGVAKIGIENGIDIEMLMQLSRIVQVTNQASHLGNEINKASKAPVEDNDDHKVEIVGRLPV